MPPPAETPRLLPSLLDRLLDPESMGGTIAGYDHRQMITVVRSDLEDLLNTRRTAPPEIADYPECARSIVAYGLPDFSSAPLKTAQQAAELARIVTEVIRVNEPRLKNIRVTVIRDGATGPPALRFHIDAQLNLNPAPEVGFETVVELITGRATVRSDGGFG